MCGFEASAKSRQPSCKRDRQKRNVNYRHCEGCWQESPEKPTKPAWDFFFFFFFPSVNVVFALERWRTKFQRVTRPPRFTRKKKKKSFFFPNLYAIKVLLFSLKTNFIVWILFFLFLLLLHFIPFYSIFIDFVYFIFSTLYLKIKFYAEKFY